MRIETVRIKNYRSLKNVELKLSSYAAFIGANGSGKSSVLYALDWFFNESAVTKTDLHCYEEIPELAAGDAAEQENKPTEKSADPANSEMSVEVELVDLSDEDRKRLGTYGRADKATLRRIWSPHEGGQSRLIGNSRQGPGFNAVRSATPLKEKRSAYDRLQPTIQGLRKLTGVPSKASIDEALDDWESDPNNASQLEDVPAWDANQMMGWNGTNALKECIRFILIPAAVKISEEVGSASKGSALSDVINHLVVPATVGALDNWIEQNRETLDELRSEIGANIDTTLAREQERINQTLQSLVPDASVSLVNQIPKILPKVTPTISTRVTIDSFTNDLSCQGHGVQRAVMIAVFQALVPDEESPVATDETDGGGEAPTDGQFANGDTTDAPSLVVAIEEPEIYQHPPRARGFARTLKKLSQEWNKQVLVATHSPYFVRPDQFRNLHRFVHAGCETEIHSTDSQVIASSIGKNVNEVQKELVTRIATEFSEGFFAEVAVLVEGHTDRVVIESIAELLNGNLDVGGVAVISVGGKEAIACAHAILRSLQVATYVIVDGDAGASQRVPQGNMTDVEWAEKREKANKSSKFSTERLMISLRDGEQNSNYTFGDSTCVAERFTIWHDDLEAELCQWSSCAAAAKNMGLDFGTRSRKSAHLYANAVSSASVDDLPESLKGAINAITKLARSTRSNQCSH